MKSAMYAAIAAAIALSGCGTITRGTTDTVTIETKPEDASISTSLGHSCPRSPCTVEVSRKTEFTAYAERAGYQSGSQRIGTKVSGQGAAGMAGNALIGGLIGVGVDAATGAAMDHYPNPALIVLEPVNPDNPQTPRFEAPAQAAPRESEPVS